MMKKKFAIALCTMLSICGVAFAYSATINSYSYDISFNGCNYVVAPPSGTHDVSNWITGLTYELEIKCHSGDTPPNTYALVASGSGPANNGVWGTNLGPLNYNSITYPPQPDCATSYDATVYLKVYKEAWHTCPWLPGNCDRTLMYETSWEVVINTVP